MAKNQKAEQPSRQLFDAQLTFQMKSYEKRALEAQVDGQKNKVKGDVCRQMMYEYFANHGIDPLQFR